MSPRNWARPSFAATTGAADDSFPTEAELCLKFGVSRTAVREAVKMLSAKGLVSSRAAPGNPRQCRRKNWSILDPDLLQSSAGRQPERAWC